MKLTAAQLHDLADLYEQAGSGFENFYEDHDSGARKAAAKRLFAMAVRATRRAMDREAEEGSLKAGDLS